MALQVEQAVDDGVLDDRSWKPMALVEAFSACHLWTVSGHTG
jgi:hypothetical protein